MSERWKIDELAQVVEAALDTADYGGQESGRVRSVPDARTIRYYTTLGLLDKPAEMRGRTAYYGRRHVLQLVAIKRLQSQGRPLTDVQQVLAGADDRRLRRCAALPAGFWERVSIPRGDTAAAGVEGIGRQRSDAFWKQAPQLDAAAAAEAADRVTPVTAMHLHVAPGVRLEVEGVDPGRVQEESFQGVAAALQALAAALRRAGWISGVQAQSPASEQLSAGRSAEESEEHS
jgi:DNA-binding transcriptional MerR regulator